MLPLVAGDTKGRLEGRVLDEQRLPVAGATVLLPSEAATRECDAPRVVWAPYTEPQAKDERPPEPSATTTDAEGRWTFTLPAGSSATRLVLVQAPSFEPALTEVSIDKTTEIPLSRARPVRIRLLDPEDAPIAGRFVRLVPLDLCESLFRELPALVLEARTSDDGTVAWPAALPGTRFVELDGGAETLEVGPLILGRGSRWFRIRPARTPPREEIWRRPAEGEPVATGPASIVIREERSGRPVEWAMVVTDHPRQGRRVAFVSTDAGEVRLNLPVEGRVHMGASHPGARVPSASFPVQGAGDRPFELTVPDLAAVRGEVQSAVSGEALQDAEVALTPLSLQERDTEIAILCASDDEGRFRFDEVPQGVYTLRASAPGHLAEQRVVTVEGDDDPSHTLVLNTWGSVRGFVIGLGDDETASSTLLLSEAGKASNTKRSVEEDGAFVFARVRPGPVLVYLETRAPQHHQRMLSEFVEVLPGKATEVRFDLARGVEIEGTVTLGGETVVQGEVAFERYRPGQEHSFVATRTDGDGRYRVVLPAAGPFEVRLLRNGPWEPLTQSRIRIEVGDDESADEGTVRRDLPFGNGRIQLRLVDGDGNPLAGQAMLWRVPERGESPYEMGNRGHLGMWPTGREGRLTIAALSPGRYRVAVGEQGYHVASQPEPVEIEGQNETIDLGAITLLRGRTLTLTARGPDGEPVEGARIGIFPGRSSGTNLWDLVASGETDGAGRARIEGLPGSGALRAVGLFPGYAPAVAGFAMQNRDTDELPLQFERGGHLEVFVYDRNGAPLPFRSVVLLDEAGEDVTTWYEIGSSMTGALTFTDHRGRLLLRSVRPGTYRVLVPGVGQEERASALVVRGALSTVSIAVEPSNGGDGP